MKRHLQDVSDADLAKWIEQGESIAKVKMTFTVEYDVFLTNEIEPGTAEIPRHKVLQRVLRVNDRRRSTGAPRRIPTEQEDGQLERRIAEVKEEEEFAKARLPQLIDEAISDFYIELNQYGLPMPVGRPAKWTKSNLRAAVLKAAKEAGQQQRPTLDAVTKIIQREYAETAPPTGDALQKMLKNYGIQWRAIIAECKKNQGASISDRMPT